MECNGSSVNPLQPNDWFNLLEFLDVCFWNRSFFWFMLLGVGAYNCAELAWFGMIQMGLMRFESLTRVLFNTFLLVPWAKELARNPPEDDWTHSEAPGKNYLSCARTFHIFFSKRPRSTCGFRFSMLSALRCSTSWIDVPAARWFGIKDAAKCWQPLRNARVGLDLQWAQLACFCPQSTSEKMSWRTDIRKLRSCPHVCVLHVLSFLTASVVAELHYCWALAGRMLHPSGFGFKLRLGQKYLANAVPPNPLDL